MITTSFRMIGYGLACFLFLASISFSQEPPAPRPKLELPNTERDRSERTDLPLTDVATGPIDTTEPIQIDYLSPHTPVQLVEIEQMAYAASPAIREACARRSALNGKRLQAGLSPNPIAGIRGEDIFEDGNGGRYGFYYGQEIVRGNKLSLSQQVIDQQINFLCEKIKMLKQRLSTDVRTRYYQVLLAQKRSELSQTLVHMMTEIVRVSEGLVEAKEAARTTVLQSQIELERFKVVAAQARNDLTAARGQLAVLIGEADLPTDSLQGNVSDVPELPNIESLYDQLLSASPELSAELAKIETAKSTLRRANVEAVQNLTWQTGLSYDTASDNVVADFQIGMPLPTTDLNQGNIQQARYQIAIAKAAVEKKVLQLRHRLIEAYRGYVEAKLQVEGYSNSILPKSKKSLELITEGYKAGEVGFLEVLNAQRTLFEAELEYLDRLQQLRTKTIAIQGKLLSGSLNQ